MNEERMMELGDGPGDPSEAAAIDPARIYRMAVVTEEKLMGRGPSTIPKGSLPLP